MRLLIVTTLFLQLFSAVCTAQDPVENPPTPIPASAKKAWEKAEKNIRRNRDIYEEANAKALALLARDLEKLTPPVSVDELVRQCRGYIVSLDAKAAPPVAPPPSKDTFAFNGHRYQIVLETLSWTDAKKWCEERGGYLAIVDSRAEHGFITQMLQAYRNANIQRLGEDNVWIGVTKDAQTKQWKWADGTKMMYSDWEPHFPLPEETRDYTVMKMTNGKWVNMWDRVTPGVYFLCEWDKLR